MASDMLHLQLGDHILSSHLQACNHPIKFPGHIEKYSDNNDTFAIIRATVEVIRIKNDKLELIVWALPRTN